MRCRCRSCCVCSVIVGVRRRKKGINYKILTEKIVPNISLPNTIFQKVNTPTFTKTGWMTLNNNLKRTGIGVESMVSGIREIYSVTSYIF